MDIKNPEFNRKVEEIKTKVGPATLSINRIPDKTKKRFMQIAESEFCKDYGMTLKYLVDLRDGLMITPESRTIQEIFEKIDVLASEVSKLKAMAEEAPKENKVKLLSGKELNRRKQK